MSSAASDGSTLVLQSHSWDGDLSNEVRGRFWMGGRAQIAPACGLRDLRGSHPSSQIRSERDVVVRNRRRTTGIVTAGRSGSRRRHPPRLALSTASRLALRASKQNHVAGADFGGLALVALLIVPFTSLERAFDVDQAPFAQVLVTDLG